MMGKRNISLNIVYVHSVILTDLQLFHLPFSPLSQVSNTLKSDLNKVGFLTALLNVLRISMLLASALSIFMTFNKLIIIKYQIPYLPNRDECEKSWISNFIRSKLWDIMKKEEKNDLYEGVTAE